MNRHASEALLKKRIEQIPRGLSPDEWLRRFNAAHDAHMSRVWHGANTAIARVRAAEEDAAAREKDRQRNARIDAKLDWVFRVMSLQYAPEFIGDGI